MATGPTPLVLVPGLLCSDDLFARQIEHFSTRRDVYIGRVLHHDRLEAMAEQILALAPPRFALAGLSLGGYVAFEILRQAPERVDRLALLDTNARADRADQVAQRRMLIGLGRTLGVRTVQAAVLPYLVHKRRLTDRPLVDRVLAMAEAVGRPAFERQQEAIIARPDNRPFLAEIRCPTLIVVGAQDTMTPPKVAEEMHAGITGSRLEIIDDCGHLSTMEQPDKVNVVLEDWLEN